uniref:Ribosomal protein L20 n=1 Tax=Karlodinium veneficum TaxID=407301 RepID=A0A067XSA7_KARVE|nr:ribosomal protein L20 [Karlodinium veneficum]
MEGIFYGKLNMYMKISNYLLNRKILAQLLFLDPYILKRVILCPDKNILR